MRIFLPRALVLMCMRAHWLEGCNGEISNSAVIGRVHSDTNRVGGLVGIMVAADKLSRRASAELVCRRVDRRRPRGRFGGGDAGGDAGCLGDSEGSGRCFGECKGWGLDRTNEHHRRFQIPLADIGE